MEIFSTGLMERQILGNSLFQYAMAAVSFVLILALLHFLKNIVISYLKTLAARTATDLDDLAVELLEMLGWLEYQLLALFIATRPLTLHLWINSVIKAAVLIIFTWRGINIIQRLSCYWMKRLTLNRQLSAEASSSVNNGMQVIIKALLWAGASLFVLDNMGVNITALVTGLGIGGVAVALAAQAILGDLFNFFVILLDKPFKLGDFIISDNVMGTIEYVGLKSTRIRSLSGEVVVVSNSNLLSSRIKNYMQMEKRRVVFRTSVVYQTSPEHLRLIPSLIKKAIEKRPETSFDRCNFAAMEASSLDFETVYYVNSGDYALYMNIHESILLDIVDEFRKEGIGCAYPTQTIYLHKEG